MTMELSLTSNIQYLKGVGEKRAALYQKLGITTIHQLLYHFPRGYINVSAPYGIKDAPLGTPVPIKAMVVKASGEQRIRKGLSVFKVKVCDEHASMSITFYNAKYTVESLKAGEEYIFYGKLTGNLLKREMNSPMIFDLQTAGGFIPVYSLTAGLTSKMIGVNVRYALENLSETIDEPLPGDVRLRHGLCHIDYALNEIHNPTDELSLAVAKKRLIFQELFVLSASLGLSRDDKIKFTVPKMKQVSLEPFYQSLPFTLTGAQTRAISDGLTDLCSGTPMNRLIQGDVGSGKTAVAAACAYFVKENGGQTAMMAPTEILAEQHYQTLTKLLAPLGVNIKLLTGSTTGKNKTAIKQELVSGECDLCIGTHALISGGVEFANLALVITDEQHRFGVAQRTALSQKGEHCHTLVMSATPIPRTLSLIIYGDLDISVIDELPVGRLPIKTYRIDSPKRLRAFHFFKEHLDKGYQGYIICPLIETGEVDMGLMSATDYYEELAQKQFAGYRIGLLHGKMKSAEKEKVMRAFCKNELQLLVSTTVIEVGVDVPNAVLMMIENAERFGLSQLHQLRGRVGRGSVQSHCILLSDSENPDTLERLRILCKTNSGFKIAEEDLRLRGPGDFFGYRQHGLPELKIADMANDTQLLKAAQEEAKALLLVDSKLALPEHTILRRYIDEMLLSVGELPN